LVTPGMDWRSAAACRGCDPELFFPVSSTGPAIERQVTEAKAVCARCPVRAKCLDFALHTGQKHGVWGGLNEQERHFLTAHDGRPVGPGAGGRRWDRARADQPAAADGGTRGPGTDLPAVG
jgi:WhiB family transcriptional regulator, redox-sensing transcriptional regulator